jgi:ABC-type transporter Mla maintaining outer membrane lipid asymmetry ATPase subunit MlaF
VLRHASKRFGDVEVLRDVTLEVPTGQTTVILGRSGSGKSVLVKLMNGLYRPDEGEVLLLGTDTRQASDAELRRLRAGVGTMFQSYALFDGLSVAENIAFPLRELARQPEDEITRRVDELLGILSLTHARSLLPAELSGGMRKRVSLARALATRPSVLLCDEPTTGLDPLLIESVDEMLIEAKTTFGVTQVVISHDTASAFKLADHMALLSGGTIAFSGTPDELRRSSHPDVQAFLALESSRLAAPRLAEPGAPVMAHATGEVAVRIRGLGKSLGGREVLRDIDLTVPAGGVTSLIGGSGSGKSVLMKHVLGLFRPDRGSIEVLGVDLGPLSDDELRTLRTRMGMLFQGAALFDSLTVEENVRFALVERGRSQRPPDLRDRVEEVLDKLHLIDLRARFPGEISSGQRKRVALARSMVTRPSLLIYDEPTTGLDPVLTSAVNEMIVEANELFRVTALVVSHDMASTFRISDRVAMLAQGCILIEGTPDEVLASDNPEVRRFVFAGTPHA